VSCVMCLLYLHDALPIYWINDGLMTFFFFVISLELKRELVLGELRNLRTAALPFAAALGGMLVPVSLYLALTVGEPGMYGWGTRSEEHTSELQSRENIVC